MLTRVERVRKAAVAVMRRKILEDDRMPPFPGHPDYRQLLAVHSTRNGVPPEPELDLEPTAEEQNVPPAEPAENPEPGGEPPPETAEPERLVPRMASKRRR